MKLQKQRNLHDPENGIYGDCDRGCLASILGLSIYDVPHFFDGIDDSDGAWKAYQVRKKWLNDRGVTSIQIKIAEEDHEKLIRSVSYENPRMPFILKGGSRNGTTHVVICMDGEIIHDPALDNSGIIGPCPAEGIYTVEFLVHKTTHIIHASTRTYPQP